MNEYADENEQWEAIKSWWRENGTQIIAVFVLCLAISLGWRYWQSHKLEKTQQASQLYDQLVVVQATDINSPLINRISNELESHYQHTPYAALAALFTAKAAVAHGELAVAEQKLWWVLDHTSSADMREIARLRLARVLLADKKPTQALNILAKAADNGFSAAVAQVKGDIYLAQGNTANARLAYQQALSLLPPSASIRPYVQMQLNQLPAGQ